MKIKRKHKDRFFMGSICFLIIAVFTLVLMICHPTLPDSQIKDNKNRIDNIEARESYYERYDLVSCTVCGCAIIRENAWMGPSIIKKRGVIHWGQWIEEEYIGNDYYCKIHTPKEPK